jgi:hypothetical protein
MGLDCHTFFIFTFCHQEGMFPSQIEAENAHEAQHRKDNLGLFVNLGILGWAAPRNHKVCESRESRGFAKEIPILEKRIKELQAKKCLTQQEKDELKALGDQLNTAKTMSSSSAAIKDYCNTVLQ